MYKIPLVVSFVFLFFVSFSQILPKEGAQLNYRLIGFRGGPTASKIELAKGCYYNEDSFRHNIIKTMQVPKGEVVGEVPYFGTAYTWRVVSATGNSGKKAVLHHFSIGMIPSLDTNTMRVRVAQKAEKYSNAYFFIDGTRQMYDMSGYPVWYMPSLPGVADENLSQLRDMRLSPQGTITFLLQDDAYEISYNGEILWKTPRNGKVSGDSIEHFHHEFTRLRNGNYMVLGKEYIYWELPVGTDSNMFKFANLKWDSAKKALVQRFEFGTIIEYDKDGNVVWSWKSSSYYMKPGMKPGVQKKIDLVDSHENSFYFDEKAKVIYLSFRNTSKILKVKYPEGNLLNAYKNSSRDPGQYGGNLFSYQHSCKHSDKGYLYLFNNNLGVIGSPPKLVMLQEPKDSTWDLKRIWEYDCPLTGGTTTGGLLQFVAGGNITELLGGEFFASLYGDGFSNVFIVGLDKKQIWNAFPEKWDKNENKWVGVDMYRASIITDQKAFGKLVMGGGIK